MKPGRFAAITIIKSVSFSNAPYEKNIFMINEDAPDPLQQLQLIDSMINKARNRFYENGHLYLLWGWTILVCSLGSYLFEYVFNIPNSWMIWIITWLVLVYQIFYITKRKKKRRFVTYTGDLIKYVWMVFAIVTILMLVVVQKNTTSPHQTDAVFLVLYGLPTFLSGKILKFQPLVIGAFSCWLLVIVSLFIPIQYHMLLIAVAVIAAWIIPGYLLSNRFKIENQS